MSRLLRFRYDVQLTFSVPVRQHAFVLRCLPRDRPWQQVLDLTLALDPAVPVAMQKDGFGNLLQIGRLEDSHDHFRYTVQGTVRRDDARRTPEPCHPVFRLPSAYTIPDAGLRAFLDSLNLPERPADRAWALAQAVHDRLRYVPGATGVATTAAQAFAAGEGVCQDFAHICRWPGWPGWRPATSTACPRARAPAMPGVRSGWTASGRASTPPAASGPTRATCASARGGTSATAPLSGACLLALRTSASWP